MIGCNNEGNTPPTPDEDPHKAYRRKLKALRKPSEKTAEYFNSQVVAGLMPDPFRRMDYYKRHYDLEGILEVDKDYFWAKKAFLKEEDPDSYLTRMNPESLTYKLTLIVREDGIEHCKMNILSGELPSTTLATHYL